MNQWNAVLDSTILIKYPSNGNIHKVLSVFYNCISKLVSNWVLVSKVNWFIPKGKFVLLLLCTFWYKYRFQLVWLTCLFPGTPSLFSVNFFADSRDHHNIDEEIHAFSRSFTVAPLLILVRLICKRKKLYKAMTP